jgi:hypothetical protein
MKTITKFRLETRNKNIKIDDLNELKNFYLAERCFFIIYDKMCDRNSEDVDKAIEILTKYEEYEKCDFLIKFKKRKIELIEKNLFHYYFKPYTKENDSNYKFS